MIQSTLRALDFPQATRVAVHRSAFSAMVAVICLAITSVLLGAMLRSVSLARQQVIDQQQQIQANWLAQSALALGASRQSQDRNYRGEVWQVGTAIQESPTPQLGLADAVATITISPADETSATIEVEVTLPGNKGQTTRITRAALLVRPSPSP